ncbi:MAG: CPBP family intramembrane metalloprotease [Oscillospiraceae bacterium]|nr:CPBP family intramembrane metalloprotease [Oscillospiraceae bacterium]
MKAFIKSYWKTLLFFALVGAVGGFGVGFYLLDSYPEDMVQELLAQGMTPVLLALVTAVQSAGYGIVLGGIGIWLAKKVGLWRNERSIEGKPLLYTVIISVIGGMALILPDVFFFGRHIPAVAESYAAKPTIPYLIATVTYGAVIEEIMLRLFCMSLLAFLLWKLFARKQETPAAGILIAANVMTALLFAAGHLPATAVMMGLTPMIVLRCFLLNGIFGLAFGWLYRRYGLRYAMLAHGGCHVVSKLIWILWL